jgi:tetratricopeptide (TPR) repeat protein
MTREDPDGQPRFMLLQTIREYAMDLLSLEPARLRRLRDAHADEMLRTVRRYGYGDIAKPVQDSMGDQLLRRDLDNVRTAMAHWLDADGGDAEAALRGLRLATAFCYYCYQHGDYAEGLEWLARAYAAAQHPDPAVEAPALRMLGLLTERRQELVKAREYQARAIGIYRQLGDRHGEARSLNNLALVERSAGKPEEAERLLRDAIINRQHLEDPVGSASSTNNLALVLIDRGAFHEAIALLTETIEGGAGGDDWVLACCTINLALALVLVDRDRDAVAHLRHTLNWFVEFADTDGIIESLELSMAMALRRGDGAIGARLAGAAEAARNAFTIHRHPADQQRYEEWVDELRRSLGEADYHRAREEGQVMTLAQATDYALHEVLGTSELHREADPPSPLRDRSGSARAGNP